MLPLQGFPVPDRYSNHTAESSAPLLHLTSSDVPSCTSERRPTDASRSHKEAERRRRQRINTHLSTLRSLLPNTVKNDKASLLTEVVRRVRELRRKADDFTRKHDRGWGVLSEHGDRPFPGVDEATVTCVDGEARVVKATVCCEDRRGLSWDLSRAIRTVRGRAVRADMETAGGRTRMVVLVHTGGGGMERVEELRRVLKGVVENRASDSGVGTKRRWVYGSGWEDDHRVLVG